MVMNIAGKKVEIKHIDGPTGVRGRNSDNTLVKEKLEWFPAKNLKQGLEKTYLWINEQTKKLISV
jgi:nucleoside-diphosphate-sugar epimerase